MIQRFMITSLLFILFSLSSGCGGIGESEEQNQCEDTEGTWTVERNVTPYVPDNCFGPVAVNQAVVRQHAYCSCPEGMFYHRGEGCISQQRCDELMQEQ